MIIFLHSFQLLFLCELSDKVQHSQGCEWNQAHKPRRGQVEMAQCSYLFHSFNNNRDLGTPGLRSSTFPRSRHDSRLQYKFTRLDQHLHRLLHLRLLRHGHFSSQRVHLRASCPSRHGKTQKMSIQSNSWHFAHFLQVILCFGIAVSTRTYVAYAALSLVVEINSIFLHARQLLMIGGIPKSSWIYRFVKLLIE